MKNLDAVLAHVDDQLDASLERLFDLLRIESISTDPEYATECRKAADWLVDALNGIGFDAARRDTPGHPMVVAHTNGQGRHMLFYGHYDVQPVDPLNLWDRPPFDPVLEETPNGTVIRARGASDDKGQLMTFVEACRAWHAVHGSLPNISILFEGEEESGSPSLIPFLKENADELRADIAMVCDTGMWDGDTPTISTMLRGLVAEEFSINGANKDLHSGMFGGLAANPIHIMSTVLAGLHDVSGRVTLPGFYDDVPDISPEMKTQWTELGFDSEEFLGDVGLSVPAGEAAYTPLEQLWSRPTAEVNGIWGGYTGAGFKTVLPAQAHAKISFRLVGKQDPAKIIESFRAYVTSQLPADCTATFHDKGGAPATVLPTDAPEFGLARAALSDEWPNPAAYVGCGGSIPIVGYFQDILDMNSLMIGFARDDDQIHSPNEKYDLRSFHKGIWSWVRVLAALS